VVIDPGPDDEAHLEAVRRAVEDAIVVRILLTHDHRDHAEGAETLGRMLGAETWGPEGSRSSKHFLSAGDKIVTDDGTLVAVPTPGHAKHHLAYHWPKRGTAFVGDLLLGEGRTTWVGAYPGCVADYLASLKRVRALRTSILLPAHGPPIEDPEETISHFEDHRMTRISEVRNALEESPEARVEELVARIYGGAISPCAEKAVELSMAALVDYVRGEADGAE